MAQENFTPMRNASNTSGGDQRTLEQRWDELRSQIRDRWPVLTKEDLQEIDGDSRKLIAMVHQKTGADISEIEHQIDQIAATSEGLLSRVTRTVQQATASAAASVAEPLSRAYRSTREQIETTPGRSAGIAFAAGVLIGLCTASMVKDVQAPRHRYW